MKKRWYPKLRHPWAQSAAGFTLVELVVVIAIMGILAGVGTVGYGGYMKSAQKKADMALVGNIIRAIEVGTNSTMFVPPESLAASATTYPVGFITLTNAGGHTLTSKTKRIDPSAECVFTGEQTFYFLEIVTPYPDAENCANGSSAGRTYAMKPMTINHCMTHSPSGAHPYNSAEDGPFVQKVVCPGPKADCESQCQDHEKKNWDIAEGTLITENTDKFYTPVGDGKCQLAANTGLAENDYTDAIHMISQDRTGNPLTESIKAAFGDSANLALQYDKWGEDEEDEVGYTTLYGTASGLFTEVNTVAELLCKMQGLKNISPKFATFFTEDYDNAGDLVISFSEFVSKSDLSASAWDGYWATAADFAHDEYTFGIQSHKTPDGQSGKNDYIWAARMAYNASFASYCKAHGISSTYTDVITHYGDNAFREISDYAGESLSGPVNIFLNGAMSAYSDTNIPSVTNSYAFNKEKTTELYDQFVAAAGEGNEAEAEKAFDECGKLFAKYKTSPICKTNGQEFYKTMTTVADTGDFATDANNGYNGNYLNYYQSYLDEMAGLYDAAKDASEGGIMIIVTMENGVTKCTVSPSSADPRNTN